MILPARSPEEIIKDISRLEGERTNWLSHIQECADYIIPEWNDVLREVTTPGEKKNVHVYDNTAIHSNELLAGALHGMLTSPNTLWFMLSTGDEELDADKEVGEWLEHASNTLFQILNNSNFQTEVHPYYLHLTGLGTSCFSIEEDPVRIVRFQTHHIKNFLIDENPYGFVDTIYRTMCLTADEIRQLWPKADLGPRFTSSKNDPKKKWHVVHAVYPRVTPDKIESSAFPYHSTYFIKDTKDILAQERFRELPYVVARWSKVAGEIYGRGPGMAALPEVKTINKMVETILKASQKTMDPPLMVPDNGFLGKIKSSPGAINYYRAGAADRIEKFPTAENNIEFGYEAMNQHRLRIREAFYVDQLQLNQGPAMTATEVMQRFEERMRLLGPMLGRQGFEFLRPTINRTFRIAFRKGAFRPPPQILVDMAAQGQELKVEYTSVVARSQKMSEGEAINRYLQSVAIYGQVDPTIYDLIDVDKLGRGLTKVWGYPQKYLRSEEDVATIREQRAREQQQQLQQQSQLMEADAISKVAAVGG